MAGLTERLGIEVSATDLASGKLARVKSEVQGIERASAGGAVGLGRVAGTAATAERSAGRLGTALGVARSRVSGLVGAIGPLVGVGGLLGVGALLSGSIGKAEQFGEAVAKLSALTGQDVTRTSALVDVLEKYGIAADAQGKTVGILEKNLGALGARKGGLVAFERQYGIALTDANGKLKAQNDILVAAADLFTSKTIPAQEKALALSRLYGRSWQTLIPLLSLGGSGVRAQLDGAIKLTDAQLKAMEQFKVQQREFADAFGDLQVKAGAALMPLLSGGLRSATAWLTQNSEGIVAGVRSIATFLGQAASAAGTVFGALSRGWGMLPGPLRQLLVTGFVANKALKFTFGIDPLDIARKAILPNLVGGIFSRGGSPANPLWVASAAGAGVPGGLAGKVGGLSPVGVGLAVAGGVAVAAAFKGAVLDPAMNEQLHGIRASASGQIGSQPGVEALTTALRGVQTGIHDLSNAAGPLSDLLYGDQIRQLRALEAQYQRAIAAATITQRPSAFGTAAASGRRDQLTPDKVASAVRAGNRDLPTRRDLDANGYGIGRALADVKTGLASVEQAGFNLVAAAIFGLQATLSGLPVLLGTAAANGRGTGPEGRPVVTRTPLVGIEKNRPSTRASGGVHVNVTVPVKASISARESAKGTASWERYGGGQTVGID